MHWGLVVGASVGNLVFERPQVGNALLLQDVLDTCPGDRGAGEPLFQTGGFSADRLPLLYICRSMSGASVPRSMHIVVAVYQRLQLCPSVHM